MKYIILFIVIITSSPAGLDESKRWYESRLKELNNQYLIKLQKERQRAASFGKAAELIDIDKEISQLTNSLDLMAPAYEIKYSTGIRHYDFNNGSLSYREGREPLTWIRNNNVIIITHHSGAVETWERAPDGFKVIFITPDKKTIKGFAKPKRD